MIHFISSRDHIGSSILTSLALHHCLGPSAPSHHSTCPSHLQPVRRAKSCLDLLHLDHMTPCHVSCAISSFIITCVSFATSLSHFRLHGICCSHTCTCGLITCVSHINTISPLRVVTQLPKSQRDFQPRHWHARVPCGRGGFIVREHQEIERERREPWPGPQAPRPATPAAITQTAAAATQAGRRGE